MHPLHAAAREYAQQGIPVFPCVPGRKEPACEHGFHDATTDLNAIDAWWSEADYNIAFSPASVGLGIVDLDGADARQHWEDLQIEHGYAPDTWTIQTPRGEDYLHLYFKGSLPTSVSRLAPHIDTRGVGSYALLPPSMVGSGEYRVANTAEPADLPEWIVPTLDKLRARTASQVGERDLPVNIDRALTFIRKCVERGRVAIKGQGADQTTYDVACAMMDLGLTEETTFKLMWEEWGPHCDPGAPDPYFQAFLERKVANAASYAQNEAGAWAVPPASEVFGSVLDKLAQAGPAERASRFTPRTLEEIAALPPPSWLVDEMIPAGGLTMFYGQMGSYKSFIVLDQCLALAAAGVEVVYVAGEGARGLEPRAAAWKLARQQSGPLPFHIVGDMPWASELDQIGELMDAIRAKSLKPKLIVIDTVARAMVGLNENDAADASRFVAAMEMIQRGMGCAVALVHHTGKDEGRGARGSNALPAAVDAAHEIVADKDVRTVKLRCVRMKDAPEREEPWLYEMRQIGPSIVPFPIDRRAFKLMTPADEKAQAKAIAAILSRLGAVDQEHAVATTVLAAELLPEAPDEPPEERADNVARVVRMLNARARGSLAVYANGTGRDVSWSLS